MTSPFPGMDPYLETPDLWPVFHHELISSMYHLILSVLPEAYDALVEKKTRVLELSEDGDSIALGFIEPDVFLDRERPWPNGAGATALLEPSTYLTLPRKVKSKQSRISIVRSPSREVVTVIEILLPDNKGSGHVDYVRKRDAVTASPANLLEIDLLKGGRRRPMLGRYPAGDYFALLSRAAERPRTAVYAWTVRDPLPTLPVPLAGSDPDLHLSLAEAFATVWDQAQFPRRVNPLPAGPPPGPWPESIQTWAAVLHDGRRKRV